MRTSTTAPAWPPPVKGPKWAESWRPILADEVPYLEALGAEVARLRREAHLTQAQLAWASELSRTHLSKIERGLRRTRRSTIRRMATVLVDHLDGYAGSADDLATFLVGIGGPTIAPESEYADRIERRRQRRARRADRLLVAALPVAEAMARDMAADMMSRRKRR